MKTQSVSLVVVFALGAIGTQASAQVFEYADGWAFSAAFGIENSGDAQSAEPPERLNTFDSGWNSYNGGNTLSTTQTDTFMGTTAQWNGEGSDGYGYAMTYLFQYFEVSEDSQLLVEWDITNMDAYQGVQVFEILSPPGESPLINLVYRMNPAVDGDAFSGAELVSLSAETSYYLEFGFHSTNQYDPVIFYDTEEKFISLTLVPSPGVGMVLGLGVLVGTRRRRP
ncbi:MAG: hypothetical protein ACF8Q5_07685 [Phycisphaerales bacterium JB040]